VARALGFAQIVLAGRTNRLEPRRGGIALHLGQLPSV
jgi:hypothetical protein